jgi:hypothetical protein
MVFALPYAVFPIALLEGKVIGVQLGRHYESNIRAANIPDLIIRRYDNVGTMVAEISNSANGSGMIYALIIGNTEAQILIKKSKIIFCSSSIFRFLCHCI